MRASTTETAAAQQSRDDAGQMKYAVHDSGSRNGSHFSAVNWLFSGLGQAAVDEPEQQQQDD